MLRLVCGWVAVFVLHAAWQVPLFTVATWLAIRAGRPAVRAAHVLWEGTLFLCIAAPLVSTVCAYSAARAIREDVVLLSYEPSLTAGALPTLQRHPLWKRVLHRHVSLQRGLQPFAFTVPAAAARVLAGLYAFVVLLFAVRLLASWHATRRLVREALPVPDTSDVATALRVASDTMAITAPAVGVHEKLRGPVLAGVVAPTLLLPASDLSGGELQAVFAHELAHLRRRDPLGNALCSLLLMPVCFHPLALWAAYRIRQTREMACDAEAAQLVGSRTGYAHALLQVAERASGGAAGAAPGFFHTGLFFTGLQLFGSSNAMEERMKNITQGTSNVRGSRVVRAAGCAAIASVAVLAAAMLQVQPAHAGERAVVTQSASTDAEQQRPLVSGAHVIEQLSRANRQLEAADRKATSDEERRKIETAQRVIASAQQNLAAASDVAVRPEVHPHIVLKLGELKPLNDDAFRKSMEDLQAQMNSPEFKAEMSQARSVNTAEIQAMVEQQRRHAEELRAQMDSMRNLHQAELRTMIDQAMKQRAETMKNFNAAAVERQLAEANWLMAHNEMFALHTAPSADQKGPLTIEARVLAANSIAKVAPVYPPAAKGQHIQGEVLLHVLVDETGHVEQVSLVSSPDASLTAASIDAVKQWTYKPYLLNGDPMPVESTVTVHFSFGG